MNTAEIFLRLILVFIPLTVFLLKDQIKPQFRLRDTILAIKTSGIFLVIWALMPNQELEIKDLFFDGRYVTITFLNLFKFLGYVNVVVGIELLGVIFIDKIGERFGLFMTGAMGGMVSSTAVSQVFALKSREVKNKQYEKEFAAVNIIANATSMIRKFFAVGFYSTTLLGIVFPSIIVHSLVGILVGILFMRKVDLKRRGVNLHIKYFALAPIFWFIFIFLAVSIINSIVPVFFKAQSDVISGGVSLLGGLDVTLIEVSRLFSNGLDLMSAVHFIVLSFVINVVGKYIFAFVLGTREFLKQTVIGLGVSLLSAVAVLYVSYLLLR